MSSMAPEEFQALLDQHYQWPAEYLFKFVGKTEDLPKLEEIFSETIILEKSTRDSRAGKFTALSVRTQMNSSEEVIEIYESASEIEGVTAL